MPTKLIDSRSLTLLLQARFFTIWRLLPSRLLRILRNVAPYFQLSNLQQRFPRLEATAVAKSCTNFSTWRNTGKLGKMETAQPAPTPPVPRICYVSMSSAWRNRDNNRASYPPWLLGCDASQLARRRTRRSTTSEESRQPGSRSRYRKWPSLTRFTVHPHPTPHDRWRILFVASLFKINSFFFFFFICLCRADLQPALHPYPNLLVAVHDKSKRANWRQRTTHKRNTPQRTRG